MSKKSEKSFLSNFLILGAGSFIYLIVGLIGTPIITRLVDPVDYGRMSMFTVYSSIAMMLCGLGLDQTLVRYFYREEKIDYKRKLLLQCSALPLCIALLFGVVLFGMYLLPIPKLFGEYSIVEIGLLEANVLVLLIHRYSLLLLRLRYHTKTYSTINIIQKASYIILTVIMVLAFQSHYFIILAVATILSTTLASVIAILYEREIWRLPQRGFHLSVSRSALLKYGLPLMLSSGISMVFNALDKLFINHYCTKVDVGIYASAMNIMAIFSIIKTSFSALWMPAAIEHYEKHPEDQEFYKKGNAFVTILMVIFGAGIILCKDLIVMLLGPKYQTASLILPFLMFEPIMYTISETTATGIAVQKKTLYQVVVAGGACIVNFFGNLWLTPLMGAQGAAISTGISYVVFFALRTAMANRVFKVNYRMKSFSLVIATLFIFAVYGSSHAFSVIQLLMFFGVIGVVAVAYNKDFVYAMQTGIKFVKKILSRKTNK